jgi:hypothetical protein
MDSKMDRLTVVELKKMCKERGLKVSGKKADLLARLGPGKPIPVPKAHEALKSHSCLVARRMEKDGVAFLNAETGLVFSAEKVVIGKLDGEAGYKPISLECKRECEERGLVVDDAAIEKNFSSAGRYDQIVDDEDSDEDLNQ